MNQNMISFGLVSQCVWEQTYFFLKWVSQLEITFVTHVVPDMKT